MDNLLKVAGESGADAVAKLKEKLKALKAPSGVQTMSGSEAVDVPKALTAEELGGTKDAAAAQPVAEKSLTGDMVDWSEYDLNYNVRHLYKKSVYRDTPEGPKWVTVIPDFLSRTRDFGSFDKQVKVPGGRADEMEWLNLAQFLKDKVNGREQWRISALMPAGSQCGVLLEREVPLILPDPVPLKKSEEVEVPTAPELKAVEDAALAYMENEGLTPVAPVVHDTPPAPIGLRGIERGSDEAEAIRASLEDSGAIQARVGGGVARAIQVAAQETVAAPTEGVIQPDAEFNPLIQAAVPSAGYSAAQDILRALTDPNFRASLPQE
jgi:hypothetical protein